LRSTEPSVPEFMVEYEQRSARGRGAPDDSAEALRRRADALLDEMMLNGVDAVAGDIVPGEIVPGEIVPGGGVGRNGSAPASPVSREDVEPVHINGFPENGFPENGFPENGVHRRELTPDDMPTRAVYPAAPPLAPAAVPPSPDTLFTPLTADPPRTDARLVPAEERYARPAALPTAANNGFPASGNAAVRRQSASLASAMTVGGRANLRSTLLPRALEVDVDTAAEEILALSSEISASLPVGHEAAERSRHLLNKAQNILQSDPSRTAEVDYYLQQVRRIVQRTRQTHTYSALYHQRLLLYLTAWVALAVTALLARYLLDAELIAFLEDFFWTSSDALWVQFGPMVIGASFAGALGGALGVLLNMRRHAAQEYGYFDRKYGLRGLLMPLLGAAFGLLLASAWALIGYLLGLDGANFWIGVIPAFVAFGLGFGQERLYGAR